MKKSIFLFFAAILCAIGMNAAQVTPNGKYFYFKTSSTWNVDGPRYAVYFAWRNGGGEDKTWVSCKTVPGTTDILYVTAPGEFWDIYFCRMNGSTTDNKDANVWNKTDKLQYDGSKNFWTKSTGWNGTTTYSTYVPAISSVTLLDNGTNIISGTGTQADPYLVYVETTIKVKGAGAKVLEDPDAKLNYNFKQGTTSKQEGTSATYQFTASATADTEYTINLDGYTKVNTTKSTVTKSATALYYKTVERAEETNTVTISYKCGDKDVQTGITEVVGVSTTSSFTAPTNITGYKFTKWTVGAGMTLKAGTENDATITVVTKSASSDYTLVANYEEVLETVYFINTPKWTSVKAYAYSPENHTWPGVDATKEAEKIGEYEVYSYTATQGKYANVIFNGSGGQTADLVWTAGKYYIHNYGDKTGWYTKAEAEALLVVPVVTHDIVVKAVAPEVWNSGTISIHYWGDGISATANPVATEKEGNWNKYTIKEVPEGTSVNVIFINGTGWNGNANQTANITGITEDKCFQISAKNKDGEGKCTATVVECGATIEPEGSNSLTFNVTVPAGTEACYICGEWDWNSFKEMTKVDATHYTLKVAGAEKTHKYKYACQASWDYVEKKADGNELDGDRTWTANDVVAAWGKPTYTVAGDSEAAFGTTWDPSNTANDMTLESGLYKWTKTNVALYKNTVIKFQVVKNHDWSQGQWPGNNNDWELKDGIIADGLYTITITFKEADKTINATATKTSDIVTKDFSNQPATLYFHPSFHWTSDHAQFAAYFYNNGPGADAAPTWASMTDGDGDGIYEVTNAKKHEYVIICRMNPSRTENRWNQEGDEDAKKPVWNQIQHGITIPNAAGDLNTCLAFWTNCQGDVPTSECTWVAPTPLTDKNWGDFIAAYNGKTINAVVERSFKSGQYHTLCLPFDIPTNWLGDGTTAYQLTSIVANNTGDKLILKATKWNTIVAGQPYIIVPVKGSEYEHVIINGVTVKNASAGTNVADGGGYKATLKAVTATDDTQTNGSTEYYVGANDGMLYNAQTNKLGLRAIIELTTTGGQPLPAKVRAYVAAEENEATGFENITAPEGETKKVLINGQLIIIRDGEKYNAQGQRL